jgi:hypothetical protein
MSDTSHAEHKSLPLAISIAAFLALFIILIVFADTFIFVLGTIGLVVTFAFFGNDSHDSDHH